MGKTKLFISHSSQDAKVVTAFVNFMPTIGFKSEDIICISVPTTKIPNGEDIFEYLNNALNDEIFVLFSFGQLLIQERRLSISVWLLFILSFPKNVP